MFTSLLRLASLSVAAVALMAPVARAQDEVTVPPPPAAAPVQVLTVEDRFITQLLTARDDDDREHAAKELGKIGSAKSVTALDYAAVNDDDGGVRKNARKAGEKVRNRLVAEQIIAAPPPQVIVQAPRPAPVYVSPPPPPPPVIVEPAPVYVTPPPVYYYPAPRYYVAPRPHYYYYGYGDRHHRGHGYRFGFSYRH